MRKFYVKLKASLARTAGLMMLLMAMLVPIGALAEELTVYQNETATNNFVPIYGYYVDTQHTDQHIIPASDLSSMSGSDISSMKYYIQSTGWGSGWGTANFKIYLSETTNSSYSSVNIYDYSGATLVYNGSLNVSNNQLLISFQSNYSYSGQNLMVTFVCEAGGGYMDYTFYGKTMSSATAVTYGCYNARTNNFLPRTTFTYESSGPKYDITAGTIDHADGMAFSPNPAGEGKTVTVTAVNPEFGWSISSLTVIGDDSGTTYPSTGNTFTMPGEDVTVSATMTPGDVDIIVCDDASLLPSGGSIGNTTVLPVYAGHNYSTTAMIYPASYFNPMPPQGTTINKISFKKTSANTSGTFSNVKIYLRCTTQTKITSTSPAWNMTSSECYYTGSYTSVYGNEWVEIELDKPFVYDGSSNIMVCTYNYSNNSYASIQHKNFGWSNSGMGVEYHNSSDVLNPETFTSTSGGGNCNWIIIARFTCTPAASGYAITKVESNCTISTTVEDNEVTRAEEGETVTLDCTPNTHFTFNSWNVYKTGEPATTVTVTNNTFEMPAYAVTVAANLTQETQYTVTPIKVDGNGNPLGENQGYLSVEPVTAYVGEEIAIYCDDQNHWNFQSVEILTASGDPTGITPTEEYEGVYTFNMPNYAVKVKATFTEETKYTITINKVGGDDNCTVTTNVAQQYAGEEVFIYVNAGTGFVMDGDPTVTGPNDVWYWENYRFTMPSENVTVTVNFRALETYTVWFSDKGLATSEQTLEGSGVSVHSVTAPTGYQFIGWTNNKVISPCTIAPEIILSSSSSYYFPTENCTLYAVFQRVGETTGFVHTVDANGLPVNPSFENNQEYVLVEGTNSSSYHAIYIDEYNNVACSSIAVTKNGSTWSVSDDDKAMKAKSVTVSSNNGFTLGNDTYHLKSMGEDGYYSAVSSDASTAAEVFDYGTAKEYSVQSKDGYYMYYSSWSSAFGPVTWTSSTMYVFKKSTIISPIDDYYTSIPDTPITGNINISGDAKVTEPLIIGPTAVVTVTGTLTNNNPANIIIRDGGELVLPANNSVKATVEKDITATASKGYTVDKWYSIGSAVNTPAIDGSGNNHVENMLPIGGVDDLSYNLYYLDVTQELPWVNYRQGNGTTGFTTLENGLGYLYSNQADVTLQYVGDVNVNNITDFHMNAGWNLVSNPFAQTIAFNRFALTEGSLSGYYKLEGTGAWNTTLSTDDVKNNQGILVNVPAATTMTISRPQNDLSKGEENVSEKYAYVEINVANANYSDRAYAAFNEGYGLPKYDHQNAEIQKVYIPQNNGNFAIAMMDESTTLFPVSFRAMTTGHYTISLKSSQIYEGYNDFDYLHLIDNMTGEDIDMLLEGSYSFIGSPADNANRFTVKLHRDGIEENDIEIANFVYQNGSSLVVNGEGTLQLIDMLGRVVISKEVNGETVSIDNIPAGAYIVRMINNEVKTQKIVIK